VRPVDGDVVDGRDVDVGDERVGGDLCHGAVVLQRQQGRAIDDLGSGHVRVAFREVHRVLVGEA
jgi:hypothetical protein